MGTKASLNGDNCYTSQTSAKQSLAVVPIFNTLFDMNEFEFFVEENNYEDVLEFQLCELEMAFNAGKELQWKPSDEQMKQLGWIARQNKDNMIGKELMPLYQDLKKLKD